MFERRLYYNIDWLLVAAILMLCGIGVAMIYSGTYDPTRHAAGAQLRIQLFAIAVGLLALIVCLSIDYRSFAGNSLFIYGALIALLVYVMLFGVVRGGARRWFALGPLLVQPSEFAKLGLALVIAAFFGESRRGIRSWSDLLTGGGFTVVLCVLIARQPDLGTAATLLSIFIGAAYVAGLRLRILGVLAVVALLTAPVAWSYVLKDYQKTRIATFLDPAQDARGAGYQQIQARIAVGSGGLTGKGFRQGTQAQYKFLPVAYSDFIFSVLAEEQGFIGVLLALGLYLFVILRGLEAARLAKDRLGAYLVVGLVSGFAFQVVYNITMSAGLAPVKGLPLPLMSYGGSSIVATLAGFGLVLNVRMRRFTN